MKIGLVTYNETPYRKVQFVKLSEIENIELRIYYCKNIDREWNIEKGELVESTLKKFIEIKGFRLNKGLIKIIKENDFLIIGGYDQLTYIVLSILCKIFKKKYAILFDGISTNKIELDRNSGLYKIKKFVVKNAKSIFGNGTVSKLYFMKSFDIKEKNIYNQYLTVDGEKIMNKNSEKDIYRKKYRDIYGIANEKKVILYSGRIVKIKNIETIINAISLMKEKEEVVLFITGDGEEREKIEKLANEKKVNIIITGFIKNQRELFEHYYIADVFTLMSIDEIWGLVINEAMYAMLPVVVSNRAGACLDLVKENINGFIVNPIDENEISNKYSEILKMDLEIMGRKSLEIVQEWSFENSKKEFLRLLMDNDCMKEKI